MNILFGILAIVVLIGIGFLFSENKREIQWRTVGMGLLMQFIILFVFIKIPFGEKVILEVSKAVTTVINFGSEGIKFVFGKLATDYFTFAVNILAIICFTSTIISILYYFRVIPFLVKYLGKAIAKLMGTKEVETFCAVGNSFLSATESPLLTKPYLPKLTRSELFCVVVGGFSSVSVSAIGGYALMGIPMKYILIAMTTVPFSTLLMSKIIIPETEKTCFDSADIDTSNASNVFDAIGEGAITGVNLAISVGAVLIAFIGVITGINYILGLIGTSLADIFSVILRPLAWVFNIPNSDIGAFTNLIGLKISSNEFVAFGQLGKIINTLQPRTQAILSVALCNFANLSVIGISIAGFRSFAPERANEVSGFGLKALLGGILTTLITGAIVGMMF